MSRNAPPGFGNSATEDEILRFSSVSMRYGNGPEVLSDVSLSLPRGSFHFVTGPSGAGKSSLLKLIYLAARPSSGSIRLFGEQVLPIVRSRL
jgi:cell division transport system ATP-binding protein